MVDYRIELIFSIYILIFSLSIKPNIAQQNPCNRDLSRALPSPYDHVDGLLCVSVSSNGALSFIQSTENVTTMVYHGIYDRKWVGIGFSQDGAMKGSSAIVGWITNEGKAFAKQYYLEDYDVSRVLPDKGNLNLSKNAPITVLRDSVMYIAFQLQSPVRVGKRAVILARGVDNPNGLFLTKHHRQTSLSVPIPTGTNPFASRIPGAWKNNHGVLAVIGWGTFLPVGAIFPRYFRNFDPLWFYLHSSLQFLGYIIGLASVALGRLIQHPDAPQTDSIRVHKGVGIFIVTLASIQVLSFIIRTHKDPSCKFYKWWINYHRWAGAFLILFIFFNICYGLHFADADELPKILFGVSISCVLVVVIVLEVRKYIQRLKTQKIIDESTAGVPPVLQVVPQNQQAFFK